MFRRDLLRISRLRSPVTAFRLYFYNNTAEEVSCYYSACELLYVYVYNVVDEVRKLFIRCSV